MGVQDVDLAQFRRSAMSPSRLRPFSYCELAALLDRQGFAFEPWPSGTALRGLVRHKVDARKQIGNLAQPEPVVVWTVGEAMEFLEITVRKALRDRIVLANSAALHTLCTIVPELVPRRGCYGYPDALDCRDGASPVVVEVKHVGSRLPRLARAGDDMQAAAYLAGIAGLGFGGVHAKIVYRDRSGRQAEVELQYTLELERRLKAIAGRLVSVESGWTSPPRPPPAYAVSAGTGECADIAGGPYFCLRQPMFPSC